MDTFEFSRLYKEECYKLYEQIQHLRQQIETYKKVIIEIKQLLEKIKRMIPIIVNEIIQQTKLETCGKNQIQRKVVPNNLKERNNSDS